MIKDKRINSFFGSGLYGFEYLLLSLSISLYLFLLLCYPWFSFLIQMELSVRLLHIYLESSIVLFRGRLDQTGEGMPTELTWETCP